MEMLSLAKELKSNSYPGRGIILGRSKDGTKAVAAYFIMGRRDVYKRQELGHAVLMEGVRHFCMRRR